MGIVLQVKTTLLGIKLALGKWGEERAAHPRKQAHSFQGILVLVISELILRTLRVDIPILSI
jgi:hypothetical protein